MIGFRVEGLNFKGWARAQSQVSGLMSSIFLGLGLSSGLGFAASWLVNRNAEAKRHPRGPSVQASSSEVLKAAKPEVAAPHC